MDDIYKQSENWVGNFDEYEAIIKNAFYSSVFSEDLVKARIRVLSGKQLNELSSSDYCIYDKGIYKNIIFSEDISYKVWEKISDYDCICKYLLIYVTQENN